jgi:hypothetical protein
VCLWSVRGTLRSYMVRMRSPVPFVGFYALSSIFFFFIPVPFLLLSFVEFCTMSFLFGLFSLNGIVKHSQCDTPFRVFIQHITERSATVVITRSHRTACPR